jgi:acetamidase/formamidase
MLLPCCSTSIAIGGRCAVPRTTCPRAETPDYYITMGLDPDLNEATKMAVREMIDFLTTEKHLSRDDAYMLCSVAGNLRITQLVDGTKGAHMMMPKSIFVSSK